MSSNTAFCPHFSQKGRGGPGNRFDRSAILSCSRKGILYSQFLIQRSTGARVNIDRCTLLLKNLTESLKNVMFYVKKNQKKLNIFMQPTNTFKKISTIFLGVFGKKTSFAARPSHLARLAQLLLSGCAPLLCNFFSSLYLCLHYIITGERLKIVVVVVVCLL